jgi:hypothetical protein
MRKITTSAARRAVIIVNTAIVVFPLAAVTAHAQAAKDTAASGRIVNPAAHLIDGRSESRRDNVAVLIEGQRIAAVGSQAEISARRRGRPA